MKIDAFARCRFFNRKRDFVSEHYALGGEIQIRATESAVRARIRAKLTVLSVAVSKHSRTALTHLSVCHDVLTLVHVFAHAKRNRLVGHALRNDGAQRIVGVVKQSGVGRLLQGSSDGVLHAIDFTTTIELIAEKVQQQNVIRLYLRQGVSQPQLV